MIGRIQSGALFLFISLIWMPNDMRCQEKIEQQISICSSGCTTIGKSQTKKHSYHWILNESGLDYQTPSIEICNTKDGDYYSLREFDKKGKLIEVIRYEINHSDQSIKISSIDPCVLHGEPATITVIGDYKKYNWSNGETTSSIEIASDLPISVEVIDENDCLIRRTIDVKKQASNDIRDRFRKEGFHEMKVKVIEKKKKKN